MIKHLSFYTRQALSNIKRSIFIILGLSIAISMIAGLQFYFDSSEELAIRNSYTRMDDFDISFTTNEINFISSYYKRNSVLNAIQSSKLDLESKTDYLIMYSPQNAGYKIFRNFSDNQELLDLGLESIDTSLLKLAFFGNDFYSSNRFDQYINIINGTYPMNQNEVLIESSFARNFNLSVGMVTNFTIKIPFETFENETYSQYYRYNYSIDEMDMYHLLY